MPNHSKKGPTGRAPDANAAQPSSEPEWESCYLSRIFDPTAPPKSLVRSWRQARRRAAQNPRLKKSYFSWLFSESALAVLATSLAAGLLLKDLGGWLLVGSTAVWCAGLGVIFWIHLGIVRDPEGNICSRFGLPNGLTTLRLAFVPAMAHYLAAPAEWEPLSFWLLITLLVLGMTDFLDGTLARLLNQKTDFGLYTDPLTDVIVTCTATVAVALSGLIPWWLAGLIVFRYGGALAGFLLAFTTKGRFFFSPTFVGKLCTPAVQMLYFFLVLGRIRPQWTISGHWPRTLIWVVTGLVAVNVIYLVGILVRIALGKRPAEGDPSQTG